jgi:cobalamin biosynthesis protein CbiD
MLFDFRAVMVENEDGTRTRISSVDSVQRESVAKRLLTPGDTCDVSRGMKIVCIVKFTFLYMELSSVWHLLSYL